MRTSLVHRSSLREQIMDALRDELVTGRMPSGRHYTAKEIAELYGVSATPVREAMVQLAAEGLLETSHLRGFTVREVGRAEFDAILRARRTVVHGLLAPHAPLPEPDADGLSAARRRALAAAGAARDGRLDVLIVSDLRFWREFGGLFGNRHLAEFLDRLRAQGWMHMVPLLRSVEDMAGMYWERQAELVERLAERDAGGLGELLEDYRRTVVSIADRFARPDAGPSA